MEFNPLLVIPTRGNISWQFFGTFNALKRPPKLKIWIEPGIYEIGMARNNIAKKFLATNYSHLIFIDDDTICPDHESLLKLIEDRKFAPIVSGMYYRAHWPYMPIFLYKDNDSDLYNSRYKSGEEPTKGLVKVDAVGAGFLLIDRRVFEAMDDPFFQFNEKFGEDVFFCEKASRLGFPIYVDAGIRLLHLAKDPVIGPEDLVVEWKMNMRGLEKNVKGKMGT